jgi:hypothetical protein
MPRKRQSIREHAGHDIDLLSTFFICNMSVRAMTRSTPRSDDRDSTQDADVEDEARHHSMELSRDVLVQRARRLCNLRTAEGNRR